MTQRYDCDAIAGTFVEFGDSWTRGEVLHFSELEGDAYFAFLASKMLALSLPLGSGEWLTDAAQFVEMTDSIDMRAFYWLMSLPALEYGRIGRLGESIGRQWLISYVRQQTTTPTEPLTDPLPS